MREGRTYSLSPHKRKITTTVVRARAGNDGSKITEKRQRLIDVTPRQGVAHKTRVHQIKVKRRLVDGNPGEKVLSQVRNLLTRQVKEHFGDRQALEMTRHHGRELPRARFEFRSRAENLLRWMPRARIRLGGTIAGAVGGGLLALAAAHAVDRINRDSLQKADGDDPADASDALSAMADKAEGTVAKNLGRTFSSWKDKPVGQLATAIPAGLSTATQPLDAVMRAAGALPVEGVTEQNGRAIVFSMEHRSPLPETYVRDFRENRIVELTADQVEAVNAILLRATQEGMSPDAIAAAVKRNIGLTSEQMSHVENYRDELLNNQYGALDRALRDKRFDGTIKKAFDEGSKLSVGQVDKMVDAYHRKYLAYRAMTIARTEGVGFANNGHVAAVRAMLTQNPGFTVIKTWNAKRDQHTRPDHYALHLNQVVGIDTPFRAESGDKIRWPHEPGAPARQVVRCRCTCSMRLVPKSLAAARGVASVRPFAETVNAA